MQIQNTIMVTHMILKYAINFHKQQKSNKAQMYITDNKTIKNMII